MLAGVVGQQRRLRLFPKGNPAALRVPEAVGDAAQRSDRRTPDEVAPQIVSLLVFRQRPGRKTNDGPNARTPKAAFEDDFQLLGVDTGGPAEDAEEKKDEPAPSEESAEEGTSWKNKL